MHYRSGMGSRDERNGFTSSLIGQVVEGRYRVDRLIGKGGMGVVYEAHHLLIRRKVALKVLTANAVFLPERAERFRREALAAAAVGSSHVVDVLDMGQLESGSPYIVLEHLDGVDLGYAVAVAERFGVSRAVHVLCQLCDALSAVHASGIVHRDLKPENVFLIVRDGQPDFAKVLDFGICKFLESAGTHLTETGETLGTPLFMAPEQVEGRRDVDHRADIYALGALLFFMLTGRAPFDAPSLPMLFVHICNEPPPKLRTLLEGVPGELDYVVQRALSKRPADRFGSCEEMKAALAPLVHVEAMHDTLPSLAPHALSASAGASTEDLVSAHVPRRASAKRALLAVGIAVGAGSALLPLTRPAESPRRARDVASEEPRQSATPSAAPVVLAARRSDAFDASPLDSPTVEARPPSPPPSPSRHAPRASNTSKGSVLNDVEPPLPTPPPTAPSEPASSGASTPAPPANVDINVPINREPKRGL